MKQPWPGATNPITRITFELVVGFDEGGQPVYKQGRVEDEKALKAVQHMLEPLQPNPATLTAKPMGQVDLELADGARLTLRPVFHRPFGVYKDLFKVDHFDCLMPTSFAALLNRWRRQLLGEKANS